MLSKGTILSFLKRGGRGMVQQGLFWHEHHDILVEWCHSYYEWKRYIRDNEPLNKQEIRFRLFKPVKGKLPQEVVEALRAYDKTLQARDKARQAYDKTLQALAEAWQARDKALMNNMPAIEALHKKECPTCLWNGKTIFPR